MAKDPSKTEQPTPKRIQDARSEGKVITSQDVSALVSLLGGTVLLLHLTPRAMDLIGAQFSLLTRVDCTRPWTAAELQGGVLEATRLLAALLGPLLLVSLVLAVVARVAQVGPFFEVKALAWRPEALNPATGVRQLLPSGENLAKLLLVLGKVTIIGFDDLDQTLDLIRKGVVYGTAVQKNYMMGYQGIKTIADIKAGAMPSKGIIDTGVTIVTKENVDTYKNN